MKQVLPAVLFLLYCVSPTFAAIHTEEVHYKSGGAKLIGFLAYDDSIKTKRPGILVVHEWWGLNDYARKRARMLAKLGYTALAVDMYGEGKQASHPDDAGKFAGEVKKNMVVAEARFKAGIDLLKKQPTVDQKKIGAIGYCFGGGIVLEMARRGVDLAGVASFHGSLATDTPAKPDSVKAKVLALNGADDPFVTPTQIDAFKKEMTAAGVDYKFINYLTAKHAFTNPAADKAGKDFNMPLAYNAEADKASWAEMSRFFKKIFKQSEE